MPTYQTFDFPFHSVTHGYPAGDQTRFGGGYTHAAEPDLPVQRTLVLNFARMVHVRNPTTGEWLRRADVGHDDLKKRSIQCLDDFYAEHLLHKRFIYNHYLFGALVCRFSAPFEFPKVDDAVRGFHDNIPTVGFEVRLIEHPE